MNTSKQLSLSQTGKKSTGNQIGQTPGITMSGALNISAFNATATTSLKSKYHILDESLKQIAFELNEHKKEVDSLKGEQEDMRKSIDSKADFIKVKMTEHIQQMDTEMQKRFSHQKAENSRLQQQISQLNSEKTIIKSQLGTLERRINDIERQIENEEK